MASTTRIIEGTWVCERVTRYREEPIYAERCAYDTWEWKQVEETVTLRVRTDGWVLGVALADAAP